MIYESRLTLHAEVVNTGAALLGFDVTLQRSSLRIIPIVLLPLSDGIRDERLADNIISRLGDGNMDPVRDRVDLAALELSFYAMSKEGIACNVLTFITPSSE